jgi:hypothetical protein
MAEGSNRNGGAPIVFQFQPEYNPAIDHEKKARLSICLLHCPRRY